MGISVDGTFVIQIITFFVLWAALKNLLFDPVLKVLEEREKRTVGSEKAAEQMTSEAAATEADYNARLQVARQDINARAEASHKATVEEQRRILDEARAAAERDLSAARAAITAEIEQARTRLRAGASSLASEVAEKVLGRAAA